MWKGTRNALQGALGPCPRVRSAHSSSFSAHKVPSVRRLQTAPRAAHRSQRGGETLPDKHRPWPGWGQCFSDLLSLAQPAPGRNGHQPRLNDLTPECRSPGAEGRACSRTEAGKGWPADLGGASQAAPGSGHTEPSACCTPHSFPNVNTVTTALWPWRLWRIWAGITAEHRPSPSSKSLGVRVGWVEVAAHGMGTPDLPPAPQPSPDCTCHCPLPSPLGCPRHPSRKATESPDPLLPTLCPPHPQKWGPSSPPAAPAQRAQLSSRGVRWQGGGLGDRAGKAEATGMAVTDLGFQPPKLHDLPSSGRQTCL